MPRSRELVLATLVITAIAATLAGCSGASPAQPLPAATGHGYVAGAVEADEPQLHLAAVDDAGAVDLLDLSTGDAERIAELDAVDGATTDGRFVFAVADGGLSIVDTGVWTVPHGDHSHYYRAEPRVVGTLSGTGTPVVIPGSVVTSVRFTDETVLLDTKALGEGELVENERLAADLVAAVGSAVLVADAGVVRSSGSVATAACTDPAGTISTRVGTVIGCAEGVVLATLDDEVVTLESLPYPGEGRVDAFDARKDRPTVAAVADSGVWLLDTRERTWRVLPSDPVLRAVSVDDTAERVVALSADGRVLTLDPRTGATIASTEPLLPQTLLEPDALAGVTLTVDADRAYLNGSLEKRVWEIDFRDDARIARTFELDATFLMETGR